MQRDLALVDELGRVASIGLPLANGELEPTPPPRFPHPPACHESLLSSLFRRIFILMMAHHDDDEEEEIPSITRSPTEAYMEEGPSSSAHSRRNEDIALDLMKFIAMTTGYGRTTSTGVGFQGTGAASKPEEYATHLLELYGKCLTAVGGRK